MEINQNILRQQKIKFKDSENLKCADCEVFSSVYILIDFGCYVCANCAEIHRKLQHSLKQESEILTDPEFSMIQAGGNIALKEFFVYYGLNSRPVSYKFQTRAAYFYKEMLGKVSQNLQFDEDFPSLAEGSEFVGCEVSENFDERESVVSTKPLIVQEFENKEIGCFERIWKVFVRECFKGLGKSEDQEIVEIYRVGRYADDFKTTEIGAKRKSSSSTGSSEKNF